MQKVGGIIQFQANGTIYSAKGAFTWNLGRPKRTAVVGAERVHGFTETPQVPFIEGKFTDRGDMSVDQLLAFTNGTASLLLANGKTIVIRDAFFASEGNVSTEEGEIDVRFEGASGEEVPA